MEGFRAPVDEPAEAVFPEFAPTADDDFPLGVLGLDVLAERVRGTWLPFQYQHLVLLQPVKQPQVELLALAKMPPGGPGFRLRFRLRRLRGPRDVVPGTEVDDLLSTRHIVYSDTPKTRASSRIVGGG